MRKVISASRRTDLVAFFPDWLAEVIRTERADVLGPSGRVYSVDLSPGNVHTFVLWSKNFRNLIENRSRLRDGLRKYDQLYIHFTITGLGGTPAEREVPSPEVALQQLEPLLALAGRPERISLRFDPVLYWNEGDEVKTNLRYFDKLAGRAAELGIRSIRFSFAQWYGKSKRRAEKRGFPYMDPTLEEKRNDAFYLSTVARSRGLNLYGCSQDFLADVPGILPSACIDGRLLQESHPEGAPVSVTKDRTQRRECRCTESVDIGSYTQTCPHSCVYCYANLRL
ncbi:MAG: hypothetical protein A2V45_00385 [Candidatus Aminicenantes bacterium RBG_19FT_COMBO_58_17]|nr:MAG: hypothetical protein A2V45_00385 [Candidatus Aminicenantes bacterium RBG_19FT_COMBO_58_17]